jgi:uncharacterized protein Smg (DUF494 family)
MAIFLLFPLGDFLFVYQENLMNNRIIEILIHLLGHLKDHDLDLDNLSEISDVLVTRGYDEIEIEEAINWFFEKIGTHSVKSSEIVEQREKSFRILHDYERINIHLKFMDIY